MIPELQPTFVSKDSFLKTYPFLSYGEDDTWFGVMTLEGIICALTLKTVPSPEAILRRFHRHNLVKAPLRVTFPLPCFLIGTPFQHRVWQALLEISRGETWSYQQLAQHINHPKAVRAVANAVGANPISPLVPCHRVIRNNNQLGGYFWGLGEKIRLLKEEASLPPLLAL